MIKGIIFDMDGVIIDSEREYYNRYLKYFEHIGKDIDEEKLKSTAGLIHRETMKVIEDLYGEGFQKNEFIDGYNKYYEKEPIKFDELCFEDAKYIIKYLYNKGYILAIASSSDKQTIKKVLEECKLDSYFKIILSGEDFENSKPNPEIYLKTAEKMNLQKDEILVVEDSDYGIQSAKAAGFKVLAREDKRFDFDQTSADYIERDLRNIKMILDDLNKVKTDENYELRSMKFGSKDYIKSLYLRNDALRKPLGLNLFKEDLEDEKHQTIIGLFDNDRIIGTATLEYIDNNNAKINNLVIKNDYKNKGLGRKIINYLENIAKKNNINKIKLMARLTALDFYEKLGYTPIGEVYNYKYPDTNVQLEHVDMEKNI